MKQLDLNQIELTELDRLYTKRKILYDDLMIKLQLLNHRKRDILKAYHNSVNLIDKQINIETYKQKHLNNQR
jgi:hypothetical protein